MRNLVLIFLLACGDNSSESEAVSWGEICEVYVTSACERMEACTPNTVDLPVCIRHSYAHCCEIWDNCEVSTAAEESELASCSEALQTFDCLDLGFGFIPPECSQLGDYAPKE